MRTDQELAAYIGLDWGDQRHAVQVQAAAGGPVDQSELEQRPHVLRGWVAQLRVRFGGRPVATPPNCGPCSRPSTPSTRRSRPSSPPTRIRSCSGVSPLPAPSARPAWRPPSAPTALAGTRRPSSSHTWAARRSPNAAARPSGCITAWPVRSSSSKRFTEYADQSIRFSVWARRHYDQQRGRGNTHHAALRSLAFKWMRILFRCWQGHLSCAVKQDP